MNENYEGDYILIERILEFYPDDSCSWNQNEVVLQSDLDIAIQQGQIDEPEPFGDNWKHPCLENKSTKWHIGRVLYFINHPDEIRDIEIDNLYSGSYIFPVPKIIDGNHRFMAASWLYNHGKMNKVHCRYGGRLDLLEYLTGQTNECPED